MADIHFSADLDTDNLEKGVQDSIKTVKDWVKAIESGTQKMDVDVNKLSEAYRVAIKEQREYIKGLEKDIKNLDELISRSAAGKPKESLLRELTDAKKELADATSDLQKLEENEVLLNSNIEESQEGVIASLKKWGLGLITVTGAITLFKKIMNSTEASADSLKAAFGYLEGATSGLFRTIVTGDWSNLIDNIIKTAKATRDLKIAQDELSNIEASNEIRRGFLSRSLENARLAMLGVEDPGTKRKLLDEAKELQQSITSITVDEINKKLKITEDFYVKISAYDKEYSKYMIEKIREIAGNYEYWFGENSIAAEGIKSRLNSLKYFMQTGGLTGAQEKERRELQLTLFVLEDFKRLQNSMKPDQFKEYVKTIGDLNSAMAEGDSALRSLERAGAGIASDIAKRAAEAIKQLQQEKQEVQRLIEALDRIDPGKGYAILNRALTKAPSPLKPTIQTREGIDKQKEENLKKELDLRKKIIADAVRFTDELIAQLDLTQEEADALGLMRNTLVDLVSGNNLGAVLNILGKIIGTFAQMGQVTSEPRWKAQIEAWDALIERQQRVIELSERTGGTAQALRDAVESAQKEFDILNEQALKYKTVNIFGWEDWNIPSELAEMWIKAQDALFDAKQALTDFIIGGVNQIDIAGVLAQGFEDGKKSARDFAEDFDGLMRQAINSSLEELSKPSISAWYQKFAADMTSGGGLNAEEIVTLKREWETIVAAEEERRKQVYAIAGITDNAVANVGLTGQIRRDLTEETGTELVALFRRYADEQRVVKDYSIRGVAHLVGIESNTAETVNKLQLAITELQAININTKQVAVGGLG